MTTTALPTVVLDCDHISVSYGKRQILHNLSLTVAPGECVAVIGPSGSGKTSLLSAILGLITYQGKIKIGSTVVSRKTSLQLRRSAIGAIFQHAELLAELSPIENVALAGIIAGRDRHTSETKAQQLLTTLGVPTESETSDTLSGGERQRTALARALINDPSLILADEPTGSLDANSRDNALNQMLATVKDRSCGLVLVTHDPIVAARMDRTVSLEAT